MNNIMTESWAIAKRDLKKRYSIWKDIISIIFIFAILIGAGFGLNKIIKNQNLGQSYDSFFASGMIGVFIAILAMSIGIDLVIDRRGFNKLLLVAPVSRISIILGKTIYLFINSLKTLFVTAIITMIYFNTFSMLKVIVLVPIIIFSTLLFLGITLIIASLIKKQNTADTIFQIILFFFMFFSVAMYSINPFPEIVKYIFYLNPATYVVEVFRYIISGSTFINFYVSTTVIIILAVVFSSLGIYLYDKKLRDG